MTTIPAVFRNGRIETPTPLDLPDGTALRVTVADADTTPDADWDSSPRAIAARLAAMDAVEPLVFTDEERAAWESDRKARRDWELAHWDEYTDGLRKSFP